MAHIKLGNKLINSAEDEVYIIAEIGQNHQGDLNIAKKLIWEAKQAGCDCVKFQKSHLSAKFTQAALERSYDSEHSWGKTYGEHKTHLEFSMQEYGLLKKYCQLLEIDMTVSTMDEVSLAVWSALQPPFIKIGSGDANNIPLLQKSAQLECSLVISTGMQTLESVDRIVEIMQETKKTNFALLHCVSAYPSNPENVCLRLIEFYKQRYPQVVIGYSGHEEGLLISMAAVLLGARIVERHFTLDKTQKGADHKCSLEPGEMHELVQKIQILKNRGCLKNPVRDFEHIKEILHCQELELHSLKVALTPVTTKTILDCEIPCKVKLGKSLVAKHDLQVGHILQSIDICIKVSEPNGISAEKYENVIGAVVCEVVEKDMPIKIENLKLLKNV